MKLQTFCFRSSNMPEWMKQNEAKRETVKIKEIILDSRGVIIDSKRMVLFYLKLKTGGGVIQNTLCFIVLLLC